MFCFLALFVLAFLQARGVRDFRRRGDIVLDAVPSDAAGDGFCVAFPSVQATAWDAGVRSCEHDDVFLSRPRSDFDAEPRPGPLPLSRIAPRSTVARLPRRICRVGRPSRTPRREETPSAMRFGSTVSDRPFRFLWKGLRSLDRTGTRRVHVRVRGRLQTTLDVVGSRRATHAMADSQVRAREGMEGARQERTKKGSRRDARGSTTDVLAIEKRRERRRVAQERHLRRERSKGTDTRG